MLIEDRDTTSKSLKVLKEIDQKVDSIVVLAQDEAHGTSCLT